MRFFLLFFLGCLSFIMVTSPLSAQESRSVQKPSLLPNISLIGSLAGAYFREDPAGDQGENPSRTGFNLQGVEIAFQSVVDPYVRGDLFFLFKEEGVELEEGVVTTLGLPGNLQFRAGKLLARFGRQNTHHLEQLDFVDQSFLNRYFLGVEGFHELGGEVSFLFPVPWFSEFSFEFLQGENPGNFDGSRRQDFVYLTHWKNGLDLTESLALQTGLSAAVGFNDTAPGKRTELYGIDLYLRWRPSAYRGLKWQSEYFFRKRQEVADSILEGGIYSQLVYQFARRWEGGFRFEQIGIPHETFRRRAYSPVLTFLASEFFRLRAQYSFVQTEGLMNGHEAFLQLQFNMGPHGSHLF